MSAAGNVRQEHICHICLHLSDKKQMENDSNTLDPLREMLCIHAETQTYWHRGMVELAFNFLQR